MLLAVSENVFVNTDFIHSAVIYESFTEDGEKWYVKLYGSFDVPEIFLEPDRSVLVGPFDTKNAALRFITDAEMDILCEIEDDNES